MLASSFCFFVCVRVFMNSRPINIQQWRIKTLSWGGEVDLPALLAFPPFVISSFTQNKVGGGGGGGGLPYIRLCTKRAQISLLHIGPWHLVCTAGSTSEVLGQGLSNSSEDFVSNEITSKRTK